MAIADINNEEFTTKMCDNEFLKCVTCGSKVDLIIDYGMTETVRHDLNLCIDCAEVLRGKLESYLDDGMTDDMEEDEEFEDEEDVNDVAEEVLIKDSEFEGLDPSYLEPAVGNTDTENKLINNGYAVQGDGPVECE